MRIDSHQHFWKYDPVAYEWIDPARMSVLQRDFLPRDLASELDGVGLDRSVAVQARQTLEESRWLLELAEANDRVAGVVGWVDLRSPHLEEVLAPLAEHPKFVGVRHVVQDEPEDDFMLGDAFQRGIAKLPSFGLTYDVLIYPRQLPAAIELARALPDVRLVIDHLAKPNIREGGLRPWKQHMQSLATMDHVWCKVSGMVTEAAWGAWTASDFHPYLDVVFEAFGSRRILFGSDWPVCLCSGSYEAVHGLVAAYVRELSGAEQAAIFGGNAADFYGLKC